MLAQGDGASPFLETPDQMVRRVCRELGTKKTIVVLNDEAHHCYCRRVDTTGDCYKGVWRRTMNSTGGTARPAGGEVSGEMMSRSNLEPQEEAGSGRRVEAVLDFLEGFYRLAHPPVRQTTEYREFHLRQQELPTGRAVSLSPGAEVWLTSRLLEHPHPPQIPDDLADWLDDVTLSPHKPPGIDPWDGDEDDDRTEEELEADLEAAILLEEWVTAHWKPWSELWHEAEACRAFYKQLYALRTQLDRDRDTYELAWGFGRLRWTINGHTVDHPLVTVAAEVQLDERGDLIVRPSGTADVEIAPFADLPFADREQYQELRRDRAAEDIELWSEASRQDLLRRLLRCIDHDGVLVDPPHCSSEDRRGRRRMGSLRAETSRRLRRVH